MPRGVVWRLQIIGPRTEPCGTTKEALILLEDSSVDAEGERDER